MGMITNVGTVPISMLNVLMVIDCAEFNEWKGSQRLEGTLSCIVGFATKVGSAFGAGIMGVLLSISGFTGTMETMPGSAFMMIRLLFSLIPAALYLFVLGSLKFYKLEKNIDKIRTENIENREKKLEESGSGCDSK